jgi:hypothetical protein
LHPENREIEGKLPNGSKQSHNTQCFQSEIQTTHQVRPVSGLRHIPKPFGFVKFGCVNLFQPLNAHNKIVEVPVRTAPEGTSPKGKDLQWQKKKQKTKKKKQKKKNAFWTSQPPPNTFIREYTRGNAHVPWSIIDIDTRPGATTINGYQGAIQL